MKTIMKSALFFMAVTFGAVASALTVEYDATLLSNSSPALGTVVVTIDYDLLTMDVNTSFSGLLGTTTSSHIHCCTNASGAGTAGVATSTPSFPGFPTNVTSGSYHQVFDLTQASSYNSAFITANGGTVSGAFNALTLGLNSGKAYFNIHTSVFPGGEIQGFLAPVPLPAGAWLLGSAMAGLPLLRRKKKA